MCSCRSTRQFEPLLRIVDVKGLELFETDDPVEFVESPPVPFFGGDVVAGGEDMAGVEADGKTVGEGGAVDDGLQVLEPVADIGPLAGGGFQEDFSRDIPGLS